MRWSFGSRRHRKLSPLGMAILGFVVGASLVIGGLFMGTRGSELDRMAASGERVTGKVIDCREATRTTRRNGRSRTSHDYFITVQFQHPEGRQISEEKEVSSGIHSSYSRANFGNPVTTSVVINPSDSTEWMVEEQLQSKRESAGTMMWLLPLISIIFFGMGVFGTVQHIKRKNTSPPTAQAHPAQYPPSNQGSPVPYGQPRHNQHPANGYPPQPGGQNDNVIYDADNPQA